jgi:hypothetical protein
MISGVGVGTCVVAADLLIGGGMNDWEFGRSAQTIPNSSSPLATRENHAQVGNVLKEVDTDLDLASGLNQILVVSHSLADRERGERVAGERGCSLLAIGYWLLAIGYWLLAIGYWLLAIAYCLFPIP